MNSSSANNTGVSAITRSRWIDVALIAAFLTGLFLRVVRFLENRPLWTDEAKLALSIGRRSFAGLLQPLDYNQVAPVLYLWLLKIATSVLGMHEWVLRAPSLVAGILMMIVMWLLAREVLAEAGAFVAVLLTATGPLLVAYAAEAKPYGVDALVTAILLLVALRVRRNDSKPRRWLLGLCGIIALGLSLPALIILGGISGAFLVSEWREKNWTKVMTTLAWGVVWLTMFLLQRHATYSDAATAKVMQDFWRGVMIRVGEPGWTSRFIISIRSIVFTGTDPGWPFLRFFAPVIVAIATYTIWKRAGFFAALMLALPPCLALLASAFGLWPVDGRLALFLAPIAFVWLGAFVDFLWTTPRMQRGIRILLVGCVILGAMYNATRPSAFPPFEASRSLIATFSTQRAHDPVYVFPSAIPTWIYYTTDWRNPDTVRLSWYARIEPHRITPARGHAMTDNEPGFELRCRNGLEIVGRSTGMQFSMERGWVTAAPDPNWGNAEARRMKTDGSPQMWVYGSHVTDTQVDSLRDGIQRNNGEITGESHGASAVLWRVHFN